MYDENTFKNYIFWIKVKRVFFMVVFSIIGVAIGVALSELIVNILRFDTYLRPVIITISTLLFFAISLLVTAGTGKEVQDGYWKIAVLRKLTVISKKLDNVYMNVLSMGMSGDFSEAIRSGANHIRVGSKIFGPRIY